MHQPIDFTQRFRVDSEHDPLVIVLQQCVYTLDEAAKNDGDVSGSELPSLAQTRERLDDLTKELERPYRLMVTGVQGSGKSLLLNTLLGERLLPSALSIVDGLLCYLAYGDVRNGFAVQADGTEKAIGVAAALELIDQRSPDAAAQQAAVDHVRIELDNPNLRTFTFVNTPGLNDIDSVSERTERFFRQADAVIWVFDSTRIEQAVIADHVHGLCRQHGTKVVAILNKRDHVEKMGGDWADVEERFETVFAGCYRRRFDMNTKAAALCVLGGPRAPTTPEDTARMLHDSGFPALHDYLNDEFFGQDKRDEKRCATAGRADAQLGLALQRMALLEGRARDEVASSSLQEQGLVELMRAASRRHRAANRRLRVVVETWTQQLVDNQLAAFDEVSLEVLSISQVARHAFDAAGLAEKVSAKLEEAAERRMPSDVAERTLKRRAQEAIEEAWDGFGDVVDAVLRESEREFGPDVAGRRDGSAAGRARIESLVREIVLAAVGRAVMTAIRIAIKQGVRAGEKEVVKLLMGVVSKRIAAALAKALAKFANPAMWVLAAFDAKQLKNELDRTMQKARADVRMDIARQRDAIRVQLEDGLLTASDEVHTKVDERLKAATGQQREVVAETEARADRLAELCVSLGGRRDSLAHWLGASSGD